MGTRPVQLYLFRSDMDGQSYGVRYLLSYRVVSLSVALNESRT